MYKIESLDHYGRGIVKVDNKIVFISNALPDEIVDLKIIKEKKNYCEALVTSYIEKSKKRVEVKCPYYENCGGCDLLHLSYENQLKFKESKIQNIVSKYFKNNIKINNIVKSDKTFNYRNKVTFQVSKKLGFYNKNSYELVEIENCLIINDLINNCIKHLNKLDLSKINRITCRVASNDLMVIIESNFKNINIEPLKEYAQSIYLKVNSKYTHVFGKKYIYETIDKYKYKISPDSFFQVNIDVCRKLYDKIKEYVKSEKKVLDLYCGTGSIGIYINEGNNVIGIEKNKYAIEDAKINKKENNIDNIEFICGDSGKSLIDINFTPDIIIVDPPRNGLNKETIDNIIQFNSKEIVYVSCDPMTLVRDLNQLNKFYDVIELTPFDMFPNTYHIECLVYLKRKV